MAYKDGQVGARKAWRMTRDRVRHLKMKMGCVDCGYNAHPAALDFDHRPGEQKGLSISKMYLRSWESILAEIAKCDLVCANCHRIRTEERRLEEV